MNGGKRQFFCFEITDPKKSTNAKFKVKKNTNHLNMGAGLLLLVCMLAACNRGGISARRLHMRKSRRIGVALGNVGGTPGHAQRTWQAEPSHRGVNTEKEAQLWHEYCK